MAVRPAKALPLLPVGEIAPYSISERPCGPWLSAALLPACTTLASADNPRAVTQKYSTASMASFISRPSIFLPRYSGVRPTMRPAMNTARIAKTSRPMTPTPTPPNTISPRAMLSIAMPPASGVRLSWAAFTAPHEVSVVVVAQRIELAMPKRTSLPSMLPPGWAAVAVCVAPARVRFGLPFCSEMYMTVMLMITSAMAAANSAHPCFWSPAKRPNV